MEPYQIKSKVQGLEQAEQEYSTVKRILLSFRDRGSSAGTTICMQIHSPLREGSPMMMEPHQVKS